MIYSFNISTPANTLSTAPQKTIKGVESGVLVLKYIILPPGCAGLVGISIRDANHCIWPTNPTGWFKGEGNFPFNDAYPFHEPPFDLEIFTYNEDDTLDHEPIVIVAVERTDQVYTVRQTVTLNSSYQTGEFL